MWKKHVLVYFNKVDISNLSAPSFFSRFLFFQTHKSLRDTVIAFFTLFAGDTDDTIKIKEKYWPNQKTTTSGLLQLTKEYLAGVPPPLPQLLCLGVACPPRGPL